MSTRKLFIGVIMAIFTFTLCANVFAQSSITLYTQEQTYNNMLKDASFESWSAGTTGVDAVPDGWSKASTPTSFERVADANKRLGVYAVQITANTDTGLSQVITFEPNTTYTIGFYFKTTSGSLKFTITGTGAPALSGNTGLSSSSWTYKSFTFTTGSDAGSLTLNFLSGAASAVYILDGAMLTRGILAPAFVEKPVTDTGNHTMYGGLTMYSDLTVEGTTNLNGNVNLGNLSTDVITLTGELTSPSATSVSVKSNNGILAVNQESAANELRVFENAATPAAYTSLKHGSLTTSSGAMAIQPASGSNLNITLATTGDLAVNTDQLYVDTSAGNVGIGTTSPGAKLGFVAATTAAGGIDFGGDTNLYRSAANTLKTDDALVVAGALNISEGAIQDARIVTDDLKAGAVTSAKIATDTIVAGDIATGAVESTEILDGTIAPADIGMLRATAQSIADKTVAVAAGSVYVSGNTLINFTSQNANLATFDPVAADKYVKALVTLTSSNTLSFTTGTEYALASKTSAEEEVLTYPVDELPIAELILKTTGTAAVGDIAVINSSDIGNSYVYRDVRPFINVGGGNSTAGTTFTIGSTTDETANDITLAFGNATGGNETIIFDGDNTDDFVFSDAIRATGYFVNNTALDSTHLTDGANIAHINAAESITGTGGVGWTFGTNVTTFDSGAIFNTDVNMTFAATENLAITSAASSAVDAVTLDVTAASADQVRGMYISQNALSSQPVDVGLEIANLDADTAMTTAIKLTPTGTITTGLDLGGTQISNSGNITGSGAVTLSSGATSDLGLTGTYGVNVTATAQDIAISATTATNGGVKLSGPSAAVDVGVASDGVIDVDATSITVDKGAAGTLKLRSGTTEYFALGADESVVIGDSVSPTAMTINASTLGITPTDNTTVTIATNKTFDVNDHLNQAIVSMDDATRTLTVYNLNVNGEQTVINTTTTDADHWSISPGAVGTTAVSIVPNAGITLTGNLISAKKVSTGGDVFVVDKDGNITTAGTYKGFTIAHSTHAQNTDTGTSGTSFKIASAADAAASDVTLTFGNTNAETLIFDGNGTDDFIFSDKVVAAGLDAGSAGITNVGNISDDANFNIDLTGAATRTLSILNSTDSQVTNVSVDGSITGASLAFDNSALNTDAWTTSGSADITMSPAGLNVLPGTHETYDLGAAAAIGSPVFSGTGGVTLAVTSYDAYITSNASYVVKIDLAGDVGTATFTWSRDGGTSWVNTGVATSASPTPLENGISVSFTNATGNAVLNDQWTIAATANTGWQALYAKQLSADAIYAPSIYPEASGGTVTIQGDLNVTGTQTITGETQYAGAQTITATSATAFLVENAGGTDAFIVDTSTPRVEVLANLDLNTVNLISNGATIIDGDGVVNAAVIEDKFLRNDGADSTSGKLTAAGFDAGSIGITNVGNVSDDASISIDLTGAATRTLSILNSTTDQVANVSIDGSVTAANGLTATAGGLTVSAGGADITGTVVASSYLRSLRTIYLVPEYENSLVMPDGTSNRGTLKSAYSGGRSYYEWTTNEPTTQDYDIVVRVKLPDGFSSFDSAPIKLYNKVSDISDTTKVSVALYDTSDAAVTIAATGGTFSTPWLDLPKSAIWQETTITKTGGMFAADGYVTIVIKLSANQNDTVNAGELSLKGNW